MTDENAFDIGNGVVCACRQRANLNAEIPGARTLSLGWHCEQQAEEGEKDFGSHGVPHTSMLSAFPRKSTQGSREADENGVGDLHDLPERKHDE